MPRGPLADSYPGAVALVVSSLVPYLVLSAGILPLLNLVAKGTGLTPHALEVTLALSTGAYAAGTVVAVQLAAHLPARRMLLLYETLFLAASLVAALHPTPLAFAAALVTQGFCTSLMLIAAVPPLVTGWPAKKMPTTATVMNVCIFGAVAIGPTAGALLLAGHDWQPLFWVVAGVAALAFVLSFLTYEDQPPQDPQAPWDGVAVTLAVAGCGAAFVGAGLLQAGSAGSPAALVPLVAGTAAVVALVVHQYRARDPLMPVKAAASTVPASGILVALAASAAGFGAMELLLEALKTGASPGRTALLFVPEFLAAVLVAALFGALLRTRYLPLLALGGLLSITAAAALLVAVLPSDGPLVALATALLGLGLAASVAPALFVAGFSLRSSQLQRVVSMIEMMRGVTAFLVAPILVFVASLAGSASLAGVRTGLWICIAVAAAGAAAGTGLYVTGRRGLEAPDIERWQAENEPAWDTPPLFDRLRRRRGPADTAAGAGAGAGGDERRRRPAA